MFCSHLPVVGLVYIQRDLFKSYCTSCISMDLTAAAARLDSLRKTNHAKLPESSVSSFGKGLVFRHLGRLVTDKSHLQ